VRLFAYVYPPDLPDRAMWELYLRLRMLSTFLHEVAHHYDCTARVAAGRWLADDEEKGEIYAERMEREWLHGVAVPHLVATYPEEVQRLALWTREHGGVSLPLPALAGDPRRTRQGGRVNLQSAWYSHGAALESLAERVAAGDDPLAARVCFAEWLYFAEDYTRALEVIDGALERSPGSLPALTLKARVCLDAGQQEEALAAAAEVVASDPGATDAWWTLADAHEARGDWAELLRAATRGIEASSPDDDARPYARVQRARALMELGDHRGARRELDELEAAERARGKPRARVLRPAGELRAELAARTPSRGDRAHPRLDEDRGDEVC
jgi:tetratricopeptide (TPR) repeat protein